MGSGSGASWDAGGEAQMPPFNVHGAVKLPGGGPEITPPRSGAALQEVEGASHHYGALTCGGSHALCGAKHGV